MRYPGLCFHQLAGLPHSSRFKRRSLRPHVPAIERHQSECIIGDPDVAVDDGELWVETYFAPT